MPTGYHITSSVTVTVDCIIDDNIDEGLEGFILILAVHDAFVSAETVRSSLLVIIEDDEGV